MDYCYDRPMKVAILGASPKSHRYSYKAMKMLREHGHTAYLISPVYDEIEGEKTHSSPVVLKDHDIHTLTMYVNETISNQLKQEIIDLAPKRVIFNPGSENFALAKELNDLGIQTLEACTLVMLSTDQFE